MNNAQFNNPFEKLLEHHHIIFDDEGKDKLAIYNESLIENVNNKLIGKIREKYRFELTDINVYVIKTVRRVEDLLIKISYLQNKNQHSEMILYNIPYTDYFSVKEIEFFIRELDNIPEITYTLEKVNET